MPIQSKQQPPYYTNTPKTGCYKAIMRQTGIATPTLNEYINNIGIVTVIVNSTGEYELEGNFPENKTLIEPFGVDLGGVMPFWNTTAYDYFYTIQWMSPTRIRINIFKASDLSAADLSTVGAKIYINILTF